MPKDETHFEYLLMAPISLLKLIAQVGIFCYHNSMKKSQVKKAKGQEKPASPTFEAADIARHRYVAAASYMWVFFFVPLLFARSSPFARAHAYQGILLFCSGSLMTALVPFLIPVIGLVWLVVAVMGIVSALGGESYSIPVIGRYSTDSHYE